MKGNILSKSNLAIAHKMAITLNLVLLSALSFSQSNLITNGDFEFGTTGWTSWTATLSVSPDSHTGTQAALVSNRSNSWEAIVRDISPLLVNGETYTLGAWVKIISPAVNFRATLALTVDGTTTYQSYLWTNNPVIGAYANYSGPLTVAWTGTLQTANLYFETDSVKGAFSNYLIDDVSLVANTPDPEPEPVVDLGGLREIKSTLKIGVCVTDGSKTYFNNATAKSLVLNNFQSVNVQCYPAWGRWDETNHYLFHLDAFNTQVKEMHKQNMMVTAHMLLGWDQYFPQWYRSADFPADTLEAMMKRWLGAIISYKGDDTLVDNWNVVNEAISWNGKGGYWPENNADLQNACEMQRMGYEPDSSGLPVAMVVNATHPVYIRKAFEYARTLTDKKLELRETSMEFPTDQKYKAFYQLAVHLKNVGAPVNVIGFQTHLDIDRTYDWDGYAKNIRRYVDLGYEVIIPEVDVGDAAKAWTDDKAEMQKMQYYKLVTAAIRGGASDLEVWGLNDENNSSWRYGQKGLLFTNSYVPKPAYYGIREALTDMSHILWWEMDAPVNDTMPDVMNYNNFGILHNFDNPVPVTGYKSKALSFDGVDDYISSGVLSEPISGDLTFSCFLKTSTSKPGIIADIALDGVSGLKLGINSDGNVYLGQEEAGISASMNGSTPVNDGEWHFIALQRDSVTYRLYIDSSHPVAVGNGIIQKGDQLVIGAMSDGSAAFEGTIDEVKLFDLVVEEASFLRDMVPNAPIKLSVTRYNLRMRLAWLDQSLNEKGFILERKTGNGDWEEVQRVGPNVLYVSDTLRLYNTEFSYRLRSFNQFGNSNPSNTIVVVSPLDPATGIHENRIPENGKVSVYPNPFYSSFTLESARKGQATVFDMQGKFVLGMDIRESSRTVDFSNYPNGVYFLKFLSEDAIQEVKIIKQ